jgi:hypothetical protein
VAASLQKLDTQGVAYRTRPFKKIHAHEYLVPGPNWLWAIDGHSKLLRFGIEIYGCIDAYSRMIVWLYVGLSSTTALSVAGQFLSCVQKYQIFPVRIRSDRGVETSILADYQFNLYRNFMKTIGGCTDDIINNLPLRDCYIFGTSTRNIRIESWWRQLQEKQLSPWVVGNLSSLSYTTTNMIVLGLFEEYRESRLLSSGSTTGLHYQLICVYASNPLRM